MSTQVQTPPHRRNSDWYRIKYRLASTLSNRAFTQTDPAVRDAEYARAKVEIDELLRACWSMLEPLPLESLLGKNREVREFIRRTVLVAALDLKALIEVGLDGFAGLDEHLSLKEVSRRLRKGKAVSPLTIAEAILREKENPSPLLLLDLACFFHLGKDDARAAEFVSKAFAAAPADRRDHLRARAAEDPMLKSIPGIDWHKPREKRRCHWPKGDSAEAGSPARTWF